MKQKYKSILIIVILLCILLISIINSNEVITYIIDYSIMFLTKLFPIIFISYIISNLLLKYGIIDILQVITNKNSNKLYILLMSIISGFPSGSKYIKELYISDYIIEEEGNKLLLFSHFPNPLFVLGTVNLVLNNKLLSIKILLSIIISNLIIYMFIKDSNIYKKNNKILITNSFSYYLNNSIKDSFSSIMTIYGTSLLFYLIACIITKYIPSNSYLYIFINGLFDLTKGVFSTSIISNNYIKSYFILFFISFGGISIHMQVNSFLINTPISYKYFLVGRIIGTILAFIILFIFNSL